MTLDISTLQNTFNNLIDNGLPIEFVYSGKSYKGTRTTIRNENVLRAAGLGDDYKFSLFTKYTDFENDLPETGELITINGTEYAILNTNISSGEVSIRIDLGEKYS